MTTIAELIGRLERATGPDRWIDAHIHGVHFNQEISVNEGGMVLTDHCVLGWIDPGKENINFNPSGIGERMLRYTASIDAAIALAERVLPGCDICTQDIPPELRREDEPRHIAEIMVDLQWKSYEPGAPDEPEYETYASGKSNSRAVAILIAILKAHAAKETRP